MNFGRIMTAMVTPFDQFGKIDLDKTTNLVEHLIATGTEGLVVTGTTGESPTLTTDEKVSLYEHVVKVVNKRITVLAGTGTNNTDYSIELTKKAEATGVDGIMLVTPSYNKPCQKGLYEHFSKIASATALPIMLYNIPGRSVVNMTAETTIKLSQISNIVSIKEASGDLEQVSEIITNTKSGFTVYSGDDSMTLPMMAIGADGIVSVASHVIGNDIKKMVYAFLEGNYKEAAQIHRNHLVKMKAMFIAPSPAPVKKALEIIGIDVGGLRLPLVELSEADEQYIRKYFDHSSK